MLVYFRTCLSQLQVKKYNIKNKAWILVAFLFFNGCDSLTNIKDHTGSKSNNRNQLKFRLVDPVSEEPLKNIEIRIPDYEKISKKKVDKKHTSSCGFGAFNKEDYKIIKTNKDGIFYMSDKSLDRKFRRSLYIPEMNSFLTFIFDKELISTIYREGFGRVPTLLFTV